MANAQLCLIVPLGDTGIGGGGVPAHPIYNPAYPDQGLPSGGRPSQPIYHPGHPDHGLPAHPDHTLPPIGGKPSHPWVPPTGLPSHPIFIPGSPEHPWVPPSGEIPNPPGDLANQIVVAVYRPGQGWTVSSAPIGPSHPMPPTPVG